MPFRVDILAVGIEYYSTERLYLMSSEKRHTHPQMSVKFTQFAYTLALKGLFDHPRQPNELSNYKKWWNCPASGLTCKCDIRGFKRTVIEQELLRALFLKQDLVDLNALIELKYHLGDSYVFALAITCNFLVYLIFC